MRYQVVRFLVYEEPIWRFSAQIAPVEAANHPELHAVGDSIVEPDNQGLAIYSAVEPFDDFHVALSERGHEWLIAAVGALKRHFRKSTPTGVLRLYRDPIDGALRNLAE